MENTKKFDVKNFLTNNGLYIVIIAIILYTGFTRDNFFTMRTAMNILSNTSVRFIIALGASGTLIVGGPDLSGGRVVGLSAIITGTLVQRPDFIDKFYPNLPDMPIIVPLIIVILVGAFVGMINGIVVAKFHVPSFLATLGMQIIIYGVNMLYGRNQPVGTFKQEFVRIGQGDFLGVPYLTIIAALVGIGMWVLYNKTRHGKYMYAIGGNEEAAEVSGVNVAMSKIRIFILAGVLYSIAGYLLSAKTGSVGPSSGEGYELEAIASATIGGVSSAGGEGTVPGVLLGVFIFELLKVALAYLGVSPDVTNIIQGAIIIVAVALDVRKTMGRK
ncbi:MAG: beta-methylgalactoside transporter [Atopostipes suicloacalis]|nr:beta-methylgalactoside transporter [Atopostipes suicloacalis]MDN6730857.1 beta-methylgalactoside transporter [Atopostipes suicloacalis]